MPVVGPVPYCVGRVSVKSNALPASFYSSDPLKSQKSWRVRSLQKKQKKKRKKKEEDGFTVSTPLDKECHHFLSNNPEKRPLKKRH
jgi:hypothetical protein